MFIAEDLFPQATTTVMAMASQSLPAIFDAIWARVAALWRIVCDAVGVPAIREFSRLFQDALRHPGVRLLNEHLVLIVLVVSLAVGIIAAVVLWRMLWPGFRVERAAFKARGPAAGTVRHASRGGFKGYLGALTAGLAEAVIVLGCILVVTTVLFVFCKILWFTYLTSPVGRFYLVYFPHRAKLMGMVLGQDMLLFPLMLTLLSFGVSMILAALCRLFFLARYVYLPRGIIGRIVLLGLPINFAAAAMLRSSGTVSLWGAAYAATLIPTLLSFSFCFGFAIRFLPELGMLLRGAAHRAAGTVPVIFLDDVKSGRSVLAFDPVSGRRTGKRFARHDGVQVQGQFLSRRGHDFFLYRYGRDLFFQVDDRELALTADMAAGLFEKGRYRRRFELAGDDGRLFCMNWWAFPLPGTRERTAAFFTAMAACLQNSENYQQAFLIEDDEATPEDADGGAWQQPDIEKQKAGC